MVKISVPIWSVAQNQTVAFLFIKHIQAATGTQVEHSAATIFICLFRFSVTAGIQVLSFFICPLPAPLHTLTNAWLLVCSPLRWHCPHALITASGKSWLLLNRHLRWLTAVLLLTFTSCWGRCPVTHTDLLAVWFKKGIGNPAQRHPLVPVFLELCLICSDSTDLCSVACCVPMQKAMWCP